MSKDECSLRVKSAPGNYNAGPAAPDPRDHPQPSIDWVARSAEELRSGH
jgi:hypothetical protein